MIPKTCFCHFLSLKNIHTQNIRKIAAEVELILWAIIFLRLLLFYWKTVRPATPNGVDDHNHSLLMALHQKSHFLSRFGNNVVRILLNTNTLGFKEHLYLFWPLGFSFWVEILGYSRAESRQFPHGISVGISTTISPKLCHRPRYFKEWC